MADLEQIVTLIVEASRFTFNADEDYTVVDRVGDLYVAERRLNKLLALHPELKAEVESWSVESLVGPSA